MVTQQGFIEGPTESGHRVNRVKQEEKLRKMDLEKTGETEWTGNFPFNSNIHEIEYWTDENSLEELIPLGQSILEDLERYLTKARSYAADELLNEYNQNWRCYTDGLGKHHDRPELSENEFKNNLVFESLTIFELAEVTFNFDDSGMFWGRCVSVSSLDGKTFSQYEVTK